MTKAFTAAAISFLVDDDEKFPDIQWDTPVSKIIREDFVLADPWYTENVTLEDILSHRSGLPEHDQACFGIYAQNPDTPKSVTRKLRYLPLNQPLRAKYQYSNLMYVAASHILEHVTGQSLGDFIRERIWEPLGMKDSYFGMDDIESRRGTEDLAKGYYWSEEKSDFMEIPWLKQPEGSGAGEMISSSVDFLKFINMMIRKEGPISEKGHEELVKPRTINGSKRLPWMGHQLYALGLEVDTYHGEEITGHDGCISGFVSKNLYLPRLGWGMVLFANSGDATTVLEKICWGLVDDLLGVKEEERYDWDEVLQKEADEPECASVEEIFPRIPDPKLSMTLPIEKYAGTYVHKGYGALAVELKEGKLVINAGDRTWRMWCEFEHVSGEFFVLNARDVASSDLERRKAEFRLSADGVVRELGVDWSEDMDELIWFRRTSKINDSNGLKTDFWSGQKALPAQETEVVTYISALHNVTNRMTSQKNLTRLKFTRFVPNRTFQQSEALNFHRVVAHGFEKPDLFPGPSILLIFAETSQFLRIESRSRLASVYKVVGCDQTDFENQGSFIEAAIIDTYTGAAQIYHPLLVNQDTAVPNVNLIPPVIPTLPTNNVVGIWFGSNANTIRLTGTTQGCVNSLDSSLFSQFAYCNGPEWFAAAEVAVAAGKLTVPAPGLSTKAATTQPCPVIRDFRIELQSQFFSPSVGPVLVPLNDDFVVLSDNGAITQSLAKTNLYRASVGQPQAASIANASGTTYCQSYAASGLLIALNEALFTGTTSPAPAVGSNLFTFMANRFATSFEPVPSLGCSTIFGVDVTNIVQQTTDGNGVVTAATIDTVTLQQILDGQIQPVAASSATAALTATATTGTNGVTTTVAAATKSASVSAVISRVVSNVAAESVSVTTARATHTGGFGRYKGRNNFFPRGNDDVKMVKKRNVWSY
ncbi:hypothetical protein G7Y89_g10462 [Cudoniella acicularis]|uniref:Beta-lactamase-related domain-containing protein n=1 Tax=Cudoniella acicularis TaxID=354080 RepID=A0A8H4RCP5_9HELO|nr:hypothetical protein G7Y89_g10462 [Cudoniella acicularis]